jgi:hypothetical protein
MGQGRGREIERGRVFRVPIIRIGLANDAYGSVWPRSVMGPSLPPKGRRRHTVTLHPLPFCSRHRLSVPKAIYHTPNNGTLRFVVHGSCVNDSNGLSLDIRAASRNVTKLKTTHKLCLDSVSACKIGRERWLWIARRHKPRAELDPCRICSFSSSAPRTKSAATAPSTTESPASTASARKAPAPHPSRHIRATLEAFKRARRCPAWRAHGLPAAASACGPRHTGAMGWWRDSSPAAAPFSHTLFLTQSRRGCGVVLDLLLRPDAGRFECGESGLLLLLLLRLEQRVVRSLGDELGGLARIEGRTQHHTQRSGGKGEDASSRATMVQMPTSSPQPSHHCGSACSGVVRVRRVVVHLALKCEGVQA